MKRYDRPIQVAAAAGLVLLTITVGCQSYVFEPVVPALISVSNTTYALTDVASADILFVIDDSGSMAGEQANISANFDVFINALEAENATRSANGDPLLKYRLAVTSTSINLRYQDAAGNLVESSNYNIANPSNCGTPYALVDGSPYPVGQLLAAPGNQAILDSESLASAEIIRQFKQNVQLGTCGSGQEQGLLAMRRALEANPSFVRDRSRLVVVFLSDEEDCSDPDRDLTLAINADLCVEEAAKAGGGLLGPVLDYATFLRSVSPDVVVGSIVSANGTPPNITAGVCTDPTCDAACASPNPAASPCYCGGQSPGGRYLQLADLIGAGSLKNSICQSSFSDTMRLLAEVISSVDAIYLSTRPFENDPSLVLLKIIRDGEEILCNSPTDSLQADPTQSCASDPTLDWEYDETEVLIRLCDQPGSSCKIQPGDSYKVSFVQIACSAENPC